MWSANRIRRSSNAAATRSGISSVNGGSGELISVTRPAEHVAVLTIDRHERRNALNAEVCTQLKEALERSLAENTRAIVITGAGSAFCAGADLSGGSIGDFYDVMDELFTAIRRAPVTVIAYVNGPAIGAGAMLAALCDLRVVASKARFMVPVGDMAIGVDAELVRSFELTFGGSWARALLLAGATMTAEQALNNGFAVAPESFPQIEADSSSAQDPEQFALALAQICAEKAPLTVRNAKMEFAHTAKHGFTSEELEAARQAPWESADIREAANAVKEKRRPVFRGE